jgi:hypothetical protein
MQREQWTSGGADSRRRRKDAVHRLTSRAHKSLIGINTGIDGC